MCMSIAQFKLIIKLRNQYMVEYILKYETRNLIILYHCAYSGLLVTIENKLYGIDKEYRV